MSDAAPVLLRRAADGYTLGARVADRAAQRLELAAQNVGGLNGVPGVEEWRKRRAGQFRAEADRQRALASACLAGATALEEKTT